MSGLQVVDVRAALEARAGASDGDREAWLAERRRGVTATEVRDLFLGKVTKEALAAKKLAGEDVDLSKVPAVAWGNTREPVLAAWVQREFGIAPESRVFRSASNPRWLASPDGVGIDFDERVSVSEIKTAGMDISLGSPDFARKGYLAQMVWSMGVLGAFRCLYAHERRLGLPWDEGGYTPGDRAAEWVHMEAHLQLWERLQVIADEFLVELDRQSRGGDVAAPVVREDVDLAAVNYLHALDQEKAATERAKVAAAAKKAATEAKVSAFSLVRELAGAGDLVQESALARVTKRPDSTVEEEVRTLDEAHPQVVAARLRLEKAQANLARVEERHTSVSVVSVVKPGSLTITSPQRRKQEPSKNKEQGAGA